MAELTIWFAFAAGLLSFFSPCIFPLIPAYVAHLTGGQVENGKISVEKKVLFSRSIGFILGFSVIFVLMGASASMIGQFFSEYREAVEKVSAIFIIVFGLQMARILNLKFLMFEKRIETKNTSNKAVWGSFLLGLAFGSGWTPCVGLALSSILLLAGSSQTVVSGMVMLFVYALGLGIPFLMMSVVVTYSLKTMKKVNKWLPTFSLINGWIMIGLGVMLYTGNLQKISAWLAQFTPINI